MLAVILLFYFLFFFFLFVFFFFNDTATTEIYTLSLHDALPISSLDVWLRYRLPSFRSRSSDLRSSVHFFSPRSEEHTSELQLPCNLVCRLLLEKKKYKPLEHRLIVRSRIARDLHAL